MFSRYSGKLETEILILKMSQSERGLKLTIRELTKEQFKYIFGKARIYNHACGYAPNTLQGYFESNEMSFVVELCTSIFVDYDISPRFLSEHYTLENRLARFKSRNRRHCSLKSMIAGIA